MAKSDAFELCIKKYLDEYASKDVSFNEAYSNPKKNIKDCCSYIVGEMKKKVQSNSYAYASDEEVYYLARHYYNEEDVGKIDKIASAKIVSNHIELTDAEKEDIKQKAINDFKKQEEEKLKKKNEVKIAKEKKADEESGQLSLFDFDV